MLQDNFSLILQANGLENVFTPAKFSTARTIRHPFISNPAISNFLPILICYTITYMPTLLIYAVVYRIFKSSTA